MCLEMPKSIEKADVGPFEVRTAGVIFSLKSSKVIMQESQVPIANEFAV